MSEAPRASARGICGKAKRNCAEAAGLDFDGSPTRLRSNGYGAVACRHRAAQALTRCKRLRCMCAACPPRASARGILAKASEDGVKHASPPEGRRINPPLRPRDGG
jgi:hypothetical protein